MAVYIKRIYGLYEALIFFSVQDLCIKGWLNNPIPVYRSLRWCRTRGCSRRLLRPWYTRALARYSWCTGWARAGPCWVHDWFWSLCRFASRTRCRSLPHTVACTPARPRELCRKVAVSRSPGCSDHSVRRKLHSAVAHLELRQVVP